jgi:hypothetical protein
MEPADDTFTLPVDGDDDELLSRIPLDESPNEDRPALPLEFEVAAPAKSDPYITIEIGGPHREGVPVRPFTPTKSITSSVARWISGLQAADVQFYGLRTELRLDGKVLVGPLVYHVDGTLREPFDASLIESGLPVARSAKIYTAELPYWPSFRGCSAEQRRKYLDWMLEGRSAPDIEVGYPFIYFYGLERRVLLDGTDHGAVFSEVLRLLSIYRSSNSFQRYATSLLWTILLISPAASLPAATPSRS